MSSVRTRLATLADLDQLAPLFDAYRQFYEQPANLPLARQFLSDRLRQGESVVLLAHDDSQKLLGFCQLYPSFCSVAAQPIHVLYDLFVSPAARRSGAGRALLLAAVQLASEQGKVRLDLSTAKTNLVAQAAYESLGWLRDEQFFTYSRAVDPGQHALRSRA